MDHSELQEWNLQTINVMQAFLGAISPNFRMITLGHSGTRWNISVFLEHDDAEDREEIEDAVGDFDALQFGPVARQLEIAVTSEQISWPLPPTRVVFKRREYSGSNQT